MHETGEATVTPRGRRHARRRRPHFGRRAVWTAGVVAATATVLAVLVLVVPGRHPSPRAGGAHGRGPLAGSRISRSGAPASLTIGGPDAGLPPLPDPTTSSPLRVLAIGDSLGIDLGLPLKAQLDSTGIAAVTMVAKGDSGLSNVAYYDWAASLRDLLVADHPQLVVVFVGANDDQGFYVDGNPAAAGTPAWSAAYAGRVDGIVTEAVAAGARVVWVGMPAMRDAGLNLGMQRQDAIYQAETMRFAGTLFLPATVLGTPDRPYQSTATDASGRVVVTRTPDGVHLTSPGAAFLAAAVIDAVDHRWHLDLAG